MIVRLNTTHANYDLTSQITILTHTPSASDPMLCQAYVGIGDGIDDLDGTGGDFELTITVGGRTIQPDPQIMEFSTAILSGYWSTQFPVRENEEVVLMLKSPNVADNDVDLVVDLYDVSAQGSLVRNNLDHLMKIAATGPNMTNEIVDNTVLSRILADGDTSDFVPSTDGLQPIRDELAAQNNLSSAQAEAACDAALVSTDVLINAVGAAVIALHDITAADVIAALEASDNYQAIRAFCLGNVTINSGQFRFWNEAGDAILFRFTPSAAGRTVT